ncbi:MAG: Hpt domain-containing protein, partial [Acidimicrobiia bacterium]|nr:Hpt domain-containing protein [Acidimicrobiia bacterium]
MDFTDNPELQAIFRDEVGERSAELATAMRSIAVRLLAPEEAATARRNAHTIKGNAYVMGFQVMGDVAKLVEDVLKEVVAKSRPQTPQLGELIAGIADLFPDAVTAGPSAEPPELVQAMHRLAAHIGGTDPDPGDGEAVPAPEADRPSAGADVVNISDRLADREANESGIHGSDLGGLVSSIVTSFSSHATRVPTTALYQMINRAVEVRLDMEVVLGALQAVVASPGDRQVWEDALVKLEASVLRLQTDALDLATIPISEITGTLDQLVRYVARRTGKNVKFEVVGEDIRVDRKVVDALRDPLRHLVVNALDHGTESPHDRAISGKPPTATLKVQFTTENHVLHMVISDDGPGIDWDRVRAIAEGFGMTKAGTATEDLTRLLFLPEFTTVDPPQEISGDG